MPMARCQWPDANGPMPMARCQWSDANGPMPMVRCQWSDANGSMPMARCQWLDANGLMPMVGGSLDRRVLWSVKQVNIAMSLLAIRSEVEQESVRVA